MKLGVTANLASLIYIYRESLLKKGECPKRTIKSGNQVTSCVAFSFTYSNYIYIYIYIYILILIIYIYIYIYSLLKKAEVPKRPIKQNYSFKLVFCLISFYLYIYVYIYITLTNFNLFGH